jgi:hypothetical protein
MGPMVLVVALLATAWPAAAAPATPRIRGSWMAASSPQAAFDGRDWGRLTLTDGELRFWSSDYEWRLDVKEIARIDAVKNRRDILAIETRFGATLFVVILDARLTPSSPRRLLQMIDRSQDDRCGTATATLVAKGSR